MSTHMYCFFMSNMSDNKLVVAHIIQHPIWYLCYVCYSDISPTAFFMNIIDDGLWFWTNNLQVDNVCYMLQAK